MPDTGIAPPYLDPGQYPDYMEMQRKQQIAQMLMQRASQPSVPPEWNGMRQIPHVGAMSAVSPLIEALMASKGMKGAQAAQNKYFQGLYGPSQGPAATPPAAPSAPSGDSQWPAPPPGIAAPPGNAAPPASAPSGLMAPQGQNPMIPQGMPKPTANALIGMMGPEKYAESFIAPNYKPAEIRASIRAAGIDPDSSQGRQMAISALNKSLTNRENVRPGGTVFDNTTNSPIFTAPQNGVATNWGPQGPTQSVLPGAPAAQAEMTGAETAGKVINTPQTVPTAGGGSTIGYPSDLLGAPPALRGQSATGANQLAPGAAPKAPGGYFPKPKDEPAPPGWEDMPKLPISKALGAPDDFTKGTLQEAGKKHGELASQYGKEADLADQKLQYNEEAQKVLASSETGPSSEWLTENRARLLEWGVPESVVPGSDKITPTMELNKNLKQSALQGARSIFGSRMTQMEVRLQHEELSPSPSMTKDAITSLMQQDNIKQQYAKQRSEDYGKFVEQGGNPLRFESWYAKKFPLTKFAQQHADAAPEQKKVFDDLPPPAQFKGKRMKDNTTGKYLKSTGTAWVDD